MPQVSVRSPPADRLDVWQGSVAVGGEQRVQVLTCASGEKAGVLTLAMRSRGHMRSRDAQILYFAPSNWVAKLRARTASFQAVRKKQDLALCPPKANLLAASTT